MVSPLWNYPPGLSALTGWPDDDDLPHTDACVDAKLDNCGDCTCDTVDEQDAADSRREAREGR